MSPMLKVNMKSLGNVLTLVQAKVGNARMRWAYAKMQTKLGERMKALLEPPTHLSLQFAGKRKDGDGETRK